MTSNKTLSPIPLHEDLLIEKAAHGDLEAVGVLYDSYAPKIFSYIYYRISDANAAEDLTGQVFLKMIEAIQTGKGWRTSFSGWLYRIAHNLVIDHYRKRGQATFSDLDDSPNIPANTRDPFQAAASILDSEALVQAINQLTEEQAQVLTLRFLEGLSIIEVAAIIDKTEGAVKALQYRAVASLRRIMTPPVS